MSAMNELTKREFVSLMLGLPATTFLSHIAGAQSAAYELRDHGAD